MPQDCHKIVRELGPWTPQLLECTRIHIPNGWAKKLRDDGIDDGTPGARWKSKTGCHN